MIRTSVKIDGKTQETLSLLRLNWAAQITGAFGGTAELILPEGGGFDTASLAGRSMVLDFIDEETGAEASTPTAIATTAELHYDLANGMQILRVDLRPLLIRMAVEERCQTYSQMSVIDILSAVLQRNGFATGEDFECRISDDYGLLSDKLAFVAQFDESDLSFFYRLCEHWGLCVALEPRGSGSDLLVVADDPRAFSAIPGMTAPYVSTGYKTGITELKCQTNVLPREVLLQNYVHERPEQTLKVVQKVAFGTAGRTVVHDHNFRTTDRDGKLLAQIRAEELSCRRLVYSGTAHSIPLRAGQLCTITGHPVWSDLKLLVTSLETDYENSPLLHGGDEIPKVNQRFSAMPLEIEGTPLRFRPQRATPKPRVHGVLHGLVSEDPDRLNRQVDGEGSYRIRLLTHANDTGEPGPLYPRVRMAQPVGGAGAGMHFPIHPGTEVLVSFVNGDPDRPFICGVVPNPRDRSPVSDKNPTKNIIQTAAGSRLEFDDGVLSGSIGDAMSPKIAGKIHVPYEDSRKGSYLRLGRSDETEAAELKGPGSSFAKDGWYDLTSGDRSSVTFGDSTTVIGGVTNIHRLGNYFYAQYDQSPPDPSATSDTAPPATPWGIDSSYDGVFGKHKLTANKSLSSTYTLGDDYSYYAGVKTSTTVGAYVGHYAGLYLSSTVGLKASLEASVSASVSLSASMSASLGSSVDISKEKAITSANKLTLSLRNSAVTDVQLLQQKILAGIGVAGTVATVAAEEGVSSAILGLSGDADNKDLIENMDNVMTVVRPIISGSSLLAAVIAAMGFVAYAKVKAANAIGPGPMIELTPDHGVMKSGITGVTNEVSVTSSAARLKAGADGVGSQFVAQSDGALVAAGPSGIVVEKDKIVLNVGTSSISVAPTQVTLKCGTSGVTITPAGVATSGIFEVSTAPVGDDAALVLADMQSSAAMAAWVEELLS